MATPTTLRRDGWKEYARLQSKSDPDTIYRIDQHDDNGAYRCQCKAFIFSKQFMQIDGREQKVCKHLAKLFASPDAITRAVAETQAKPNVLLDQAALILSDVLRAGNLYANSAATSKMALVLAQKLADYAPPAIAAPRPAASVTTGVRLITFENF